jgi:hypothetical protein
MTTHDRMYSTVRVDASGVVTYGVDVPRIGARLEASPPKHASPNPFAGGSTIPAGVDQRTTLPHDCTNHLPGGDE